MFLIPWLILDPWLIAVTTCGPTYNYAGASACHSLPSSTTMDESNFKSFYAETTTAKKDGTRSHRAACWRILLFLGAVALAKASIPLLFSREYASPRHDVSVAARNPELVWGEVPSSSVDSLTWVSCYGGKQCARLMVPLDYSKPDGPQAGIALVKVPSKFAVNDENYKGPILFNPGGPGASGVSLIAALGDSFQKLIGDEFDIIGFDPRGVWRTTPRVTIFEDEAEAAAWGLHLENDPALNTTADALARMWGRFHVQNTIAARTTLGSSPYVSTALVARDMLSITRAHGRNKLQYWGFSYAPYLTPHTLPCSLIM